MRTDPGRRIRKSSGALFLLLAAATLGACASSGGGTVEVGEPALMTLAAPEPEPDRTWRATVRVEDLDRLQRSAVAWTDALETARKAGFTRRIRNEGALLESEAGQPHPTLPPGSYRCRLIRIGAAARGRGAFAESGPFFCHVGGDGPQLSFTKQTGTERPGGYLYPDGEARQIFVGAIAQGRDRVPPAYGDKPDRDVVGYVERIGDFKYRLVVPWPRGGAKLDVYELVPALG